VGVGVYKCAWLALIDDRKWKIEGYHESFVLLLLA